MRKILLTLLTTLLCSIGTQAETPTATTAGTYSFGSTNIGASNKFGELSTNSVFIYRNSSYATGNSGIKMNSANNSGWVFYLTSSMTLSVKIYQNSATAETITLWVKTVPSSFFQSLVDGTANSTAVSAPTLTASGSKEETLSSGKNEKTVTYGSTLTAGYYYVYATSAASSVNTYLRSITLASAGCSTPAAPTAVTASSTTSSGTTLTIDAANAASYDIYYSTSSTAPDGETEATTTSTSKTKALTGLTASTTYYVWVRSVCDSDHKSTWTALTGSTFTTLCTSHTVTAETNNDSYGTAAAVSTTICEGSTTTVTATPKSGYSFVSWAVSGTGSSLSSTSDNPTTLTMGTANATVTATFGCATPSAPSALVASSTTSSGTTLTITDAANTNNYEIYYSTSSTAPEAGTSATATSTSKTKALTGLSASTTYYVWVRSVCDSTHKSSWTALTGSTFTTDAACTDPGLTITLN